MLANFLVECSISQEGNLIQGEASSANTDDHLGPRPCILHVDGSSTSEASGAGLILISSEGAIIKYSLCVIFPASSNKAEYEALIVGLKLALKLGAQ